MKTKTNLFLASTTAIALLAGVTFAAAQGEHTGGGAAGVGRTGAAPKATPSGTEHGAGGAMQHNAPAGRSGERNGSSKMNSDQQSSQSERMGRNRSENTGQAEKDRAGDNERTRHNGRNEENGRNGRSGEKQNRAQERRGEENQAQGREQKERTGQRPGQNERSGQNERRGTNARENTGNAPAKVNVTTQQRTEIRTKLVEHSSVKKLSRSDIHFSLSVGTRVPRSVHFYELPADIVTIVPEYRGFRYILVGDEIVIIDPATFEIVTVIT